MKKDVKMPLLSPTMKHGRLVKWNVKVGDTVSIGDVIAEIETDKAVMEFESEYDCVIESIFNEGEDIPVGRVIATVIVNEGSLYLDVDKDSGSDILEEGVENALERKQSVSPESRERKGKGDKDTVESSGKKRVFASPAARRVARDYSVEISTVSGTGPIGRVQKKDVESYVSSRNERNTEEDSHLFSSLNDFCKRYCIDSGSFSFREYSSKEKSLVSTMQHSACNIPQFSLFFDCNVENLLDLRQKVNASFSQDLIKISMNDFFIKACVYAYMRNSDMLVSYSRFGLIKYNRVDMALAVATKDGSILTPIIRNASEKSLKECSEETRDLVSRSREGRVSYKEYTGGVATISNLGMYGIKSFSSIVFDPQSMILSVGGLQKIAPKEREICFTLTVDHRVVNGVTAAKWVSSFRHAIENPYLIII